MEQGTTTKTIDWPWIVEFFTKRGRPLTRDEIKRLQDEDKRIHEEEAERKRQVEEAEKRRMARLMEEIEGDNSDEQIDHEKRLDEQRKKQRQLEEDESEINQDLDERDDDEQFSDDYDDEDLDRGDSDDELAANQSRPRNKSQRARRNNDENLRGQSLTADDYIRRSSADPGKKKGKYGVTVPTPFKFDTREAVKPKSIRERKVEEMVMEKQMEEKSMLTTQFRCKPIPAAVLVPRYQQILDKNEERRLKVK